MIRWTEYIAMEFAWLIIAAFSHCDEQVILLGIVILAAGYLAGVKGE